MSVIMTALGIHRPKQDMVAMTWHIDDNGIYHMLYQTTAIEEKLKNIAQYYNMFVCLCAFTYCR